MNGGILINVDVNAKIIMYMKKIKFGILLPVVVKMENTQQVTKLLTWKLSRGRQYVTIKDSKYLKVNNVYPLYLINNKVNGYLKELMEINI